MEFPGFHRSSVIPASGFSAPRACVQALKYLRGAVFLEQFSGQIFIGTSKCSAGIFMARDSNRKTSVLIYIRLTVR